MAPWNAYTRTPRRKCSRAVAHTRCLSAHCKLERGRRALHFREVPRDALSRGALPAGIRLVASRKLPAAKSNGTGVPEQSADERFVSMVYSPEENTRLRQAVEPAASASNTAAEKLCFTPSPTAADATIQ